MTDFAIGTISAQHLRRLTDDFGIWQHTVYGEVDRSRGYALDDSARALIAALWRGDTDLAEVYLGFLEEACVKHGRQVLYFGADRKPLAEEASGDSLGEAYWALGECVKYDFEVERAKAVAAVIAPVVADFSFDRSKAYAILGAVTLDEELAVAFANELALQFKRVANIAWRFIDLELSYANAIVPYALLAVGDVTEEPLFEKVALDMLDFLNRECQQEGVPIAIGNCGWYRFGGEKALYDQQPVDPAYQVLANALAYERTEDELYRAAARLYMEWFWGNNIIGKPLINLTDESVHDGFGLDGVSGNRGSENIACYLMAQTVFADIA